MGISQILKTWEYSYFKCYIWASSFYFPYKIPRTRTLMNRIAPKVVGTKFKKHVPCVCNDVYRLKKKIHQQNWLKLKENEMILWTMSQIQQIKFHRLDVTNGSVFFNGLYLSNKSDNILFRRVIGSIREYGFILAYNLVTGSFFAMAGMRIKSGNFWSNWFIKAGFWYNWLKACANWIETSWTAWIFPVAAAWAIKFWTTSEAESLLEME